MNHVLHLGDGVAGLKVLAPGSAAHCFTDPPFSPHVHDHQLRGKDLGFAHLPGSSRAARRSSPATGRKRLGRRAWGWELDATFHADALRRLDCAREQAELFGPARSNKTKQDDLFDAA